MNVIKNTGWLWSPVCHTQGNSHGLKWSLPKFKSQFNRCRLNPGNAKSLLSHATVSCYCPTILSYITTPQASNMIQNFVCHQPCKTYHTFRSTVKPYVSDSQEVRFYIERFTGLLETPVVAIGGSGSPQTSQIKLLVIACKNFSFIILLLPHLLLKFQQF